MTLSAVILAPDSPAIPSPPRRVPGLFKAWTSSFLIHFYPAPTGRLWLAISPLKAILVAAINALLAIPWLILVVACWQTWDTATLRPHTYSPGYILHPVEKFMAIFSAVPEHFFGSWPHLELLGRCALLLAVALAIVAAFTILFFLLLPFAARPGSSKSCVRHVMRCVLLGTGFVHVWGPALAGVFLLFVIHYPPGIENILAPLLFTLSALILWSFAALLAAARCDYRAPADFPQPSDPTCDECGYNLIASDPAGRCPECGKPVVESLGPAVRPPTAWESHPSPLNVRAIRRQLAGLITHPRKLFMAMPTLTGHAAAHRWLFFSLLVIGCEASLLVPATYFLHDGKIILSLDLLCSMLLTAIVWAMLALMMVGIETAGIATFSRLKATPPGGVTLAAASKITAYSTPIMLFWVFLGVLQILAIFYAYDKNLLLPYSIRIQQIVLAGSLSVAHIGGLLWYELTVYRGVRSIQYANK